jgi:hypothetical protein
MWFQNVELIAITTCYKTFEGGPAASDNPKVTAVTVKSPHNQRTDAVVCFKLGFVHYDSTDSCNSRSHKKYSADTNHAIPACRGR